MPKRKKQEDNTDLLGEDMEGLMHLPRQLGSDVNHDEDDDENLDLLGEDGEEIDDADDEYDALADRFDDLQGQFAQNQELTQNLLTQLVSLNNRQDGNGDTQEINFNDLPDPVEDREGFNRAIGEKVTSLMDQTRQQTQQSSQYESQLANLENSFRNDYEDLAERPALFQTVLTQRVNAIRARGMDPKAIVFSNPKKFLKEVAEQMYDELGIDPEDTDDDLEDGQQTPKRARKVKARSKRGGRTRGLGRRSGDPSLRLRKRGGDDKKKPKSFVDQLKNTQLENGLI